MIAEFQREINDKKETRRCAWNEFDHIHNVFSQHEMKSIAVDEKNFCLVKNSAHFIRIVWSCVRRPSFPLLVTPCFMLRLNVLNNSDWPINYRITLGQVNLIEMNLYKYALPRELGGTLDVLYQIICLLFVCMLLLFFFSFVFRELYNNMLSATSLCYLSDTERVTMGIIS